MDILYIIGEGCSKCNNNELRFSLRSIEKYGKNVGNVFVAGYCPEGLSDNVIKVPFKQPYNIKEETNTQTKLAKKHVNILSTILYVIDNTDIGEEFLISMDDHFYIREVDFDNYPYYVKKFGENNELPRNPDSEYRRFLIKTRIECRKQGLSRYYLCPHRNMHLSRKIINECRPYLNDVINNLISVEPFAFLLNYQNTKYGINMVPIKDIKLSTSADGYKVDPNNTEVFSTSDFGLNTEMQRLITSLYPNSSKYE